MTTFMSRFSKWLAVVAIILASFLILSLGCGKKDEGVIKIGVILPLTGELAEPGNQALNGIELALDLYNKGEGTKHVKIITEDSKGNPADGVSAINKLINVDNVKLILGDLTSSVTLAIAPIAERNKIVVLAPGASSPDVREAGDYIFRNWASDNFDGEILAKFAFRKLRKKHAAVIFVNNEYGTGLSNAFELTFESMGGEVILNEKYDQGSSDFRAILSKLRANNLIDCIFLPGHPRENGFLVRQIREMGLNQTIVSNLSVESPDFFTIAKESSKGIFFSTPAFGASLEDENITYFFERYQNKFGSKPDVVAGHGYDAANILIHALRLCDFREELVKEQLYQITDFPGVTGKTSFDTYGDVSKPMMIKQLQADGSSTLLQLFDPGFKN